MEKTKTHQHIMRIGEENPSTKTPPKPFHTSRLLQVASNVLHMSPKKQWKHVKSYTKVDILHICVQKVPNIQLFFRTTSKKYILKEFSKPEYLGDFETISLKDSSNPHEAIRVTQIETTSISSEDDPKMAALYRLIWKNTVESCMSEAKYKTRQIKITAPLTYEYTTTIEIPIFYGWKIVSEKQGDDNTREQNAGVGLLTYFQSILDSKKSCPYQSIVSTMVVRNKHQHYTEASLINKLEELGIGRPSTFATIVETIQDRGYVKKTDIEGIKVQCKEYELTDNKLVETIKERVFGNEKTNW